MPIRPENKARYPKDWKQISLRIRERAGQKCEDCGVPNHMWVERHKDGTWSLCQPCDGVEIVLTVAHLDHTPENCADENLRAWCQRCHNRYDAPMRREGIKQRQRAALAVSDLLEGA
jgi:5-methylcytosine-specific restriction endonuclease McrA